LTVTQAAQTAITSVGTLTGLAITGNVTLGVNDTGVDLTCYGATDGAYMKWNEATDDLQLVGAAGLDIAGDIDVDGTTNLDAVDIDGAVQIDNTVTVGVDGTGYDVKFFGDTATNGYMLWDQSTDDLILGSSSKLGIGVASPSFPLDVVGASHTYIGILAGTDSSAGLRLRNDARDWDLNITTADKFAIYDQTAAATRFTIDTAGLVGIGGTPAQELDVVAQDPVLRLTSSDTTMTAAQEMSAIEFYQSDSGNAGVSSKIAAIAANISGAQNLGFYTGTAGSLVQNMLLDSNGKLGIGTPAPTAGLHLFTAADGNDQLKISSTDATVAEYGFLGANSSTNSMRYGYWTGSGYGTHHFEGYVMVGKTSHDSKALEVYQASNAAIRVQNSTTSTGTGAGLLLEAGGSDVHVWNYSNGYMRFGTNDAEVMRILADGNTTVYGQLDVGGVVTTTAYTPRISTIPSAGLYAGFMTAPADDNAYAAIFENAEGTMVGNIYCTSSATAFNTSSDYRLKENVVPTSAAMQRVNALKPVQFNFIHEPDETLDGFLAHEVAEVVPQAVAGEKDATRTVPAVEAVEAVEAIEAVAAVEAVEYAAATYDEDGNELTPEVLAVEAVEAVEGVEGVAAVEAVAEREVILPQGLDQAKLVPLLTAAVQELDTRIATLEAAT